MANEKQMASAKYRLEKARQCVISAKNNIFDGDYEASVNRSYYAFFHGMRAVMALDGSDLKDDVAIIAAFRESYIKMGKFDTKFSGMIEKAYGRNTACDFEDFYVVTKRPAEEQMESAKVFLEAVELYIREI